MIAIGTLVLVPRYGVGRVFGNFGGHTLWVEIEATKQHVEVKEELVLPPEEPTEEGVAFG